MKEFRPRLTTEMLQALCEAINSEATRQAYIYDEKNQECHSMVGALIEKDPINFDKDPEYSKLCREKEVARKNVFLLESIEQQFKRLLDNKPKGRRRIVRSWETRIFNLELRNAI